MDIIDAYLSKLPPEVLAAFAEDLRFKNSIAHPMRPWLQKVSPEYIWDWAWSLYVQQILEKVTRGELKRVILSVPPRHGKSELVSIRYPVYRLSLDPKMKIIVAAYNADIATKFTKRAQDLVTRNKDTGVQIHPRRKSVDDWETVQGGSVRAVGVGGGVTGHGGDLIIIDDAIKSRAEAESESYREAVWQWYTSDLYTRLEPGGAICIVMTRWHEDDLVGRILASKDAPNWTVISFPAIAEEDDFLGRKPGEALCPARYPIERLREIQNVQSPYEFSSLFQRKRTTTHTCSFSGDLVMIERR